MCFGYGQNCCHHTKIRFGPKWMCNSSHIIMPVQGANEILSLIQIGLHPRHRWNSFLDTNAICKMQFGPDVRIRYQAKDNLFGCTKWPVLAPAKFLSALWPTANLAKTNVFWTQKWPEMSFWALSGSNWAHVKASKKTFRQIEQDCLLLICHDSLS